MLLIQTETAPITVQQLFILVNNVNAFASIGCAQPAENFATRCHFVWWIWEHGINGCVQNETMLKYAKNHGNWFRHFEDISRRCEHSNVAAYFFGPPCIITKYSSQVSIYLQQKFCLGRGSGKDLTGGRVLLAPLEPPLPNRAGIFQKENLAVLYCIYLVLLRYLHCIAPYGPSSYKNRAFSIPRPEVIRGN